MYVFFTLERFPLFCVILQERQEEKVERKQRKKNNFSDF
jgi:hypothetical protein